MKMIVIKITIKINNIVFSRSLNSCESTRHSANYSTTVHSLHFSRDIFSSLQFTIFWLHEVLQHLHILNVDFVFLAISFKFLNKSQNKCSYLQKFEKSHCIKSFQMVKFLIFLQKGILLMIVKGKKQLQTKLTKSMNMDIWVVDISNQLFVKVTYTET